MAEKVVFAMAVGEILRRKLEEIHPALHPLIKVGWALGMEVWTEGTEVIWVRGEYALGYRGWEQTLPRYAGFVRNFSLAELEQHARAVDPRLGPMLDSLRLECDEPFLELVWDGTCTFTSQAYEWLDEYVFWCKAYEFPSCILRGEEPKKRWLETDDEKMKSFLQSCDAVAILQHDVSTDPKDWFRIPSSRWFYLRDWFEIGSEVWVLDLGQRSDPQELFLNGYRTHIAVSLNEEKQLRVAVHFEAGIVRYPTA
ncbi:MAG: hypothetical protein WC645_08325 [Candidatus Margulisiibacteriota bacterium]